MTMVTITRGRNVYTIMLLALLQIKLPPSTYILSKSSSIKEAEGRLTDSKILQASLYNGILHQTLPETPKHCSNLNLHLTSSNIEVKLLSFIWDKSSRIP